MGGPVKTLGSVMMPVLLKTEINETIKLVFYALVVPTLTIPMFISAGSWLQPFGAFIEDLTSGNPPLFNIDTGSEVFKVKGVRHQ